MRHPARTVLLVAALTLGLLPGAAPATEQAAGADHTDNITFLANLEFEQRADSPAASRQATDTDFMSFEVPEGFTLPAGTDLPAHLVPTPGETREFALVGTYVNGLQVVDITDPERPGVVAVWDCAIAQADVFAFEREIDGETRTFAAYSSDVISSQTDWGSDCHREADVVPGDFGTAIADLTNPYEPATASFVVLERGTHQLTIHPGGEWLYSSPSERSPNRQEGTVGQVDIVDISDPYNPGEPQVVGFLTGFDSHDLTFNAEGTRAYAAALSHTVILDTTDPGDPTVVGTIVDPAIYLHHQSDPVTLTDPDTGEEREFLIINDELLGAGGNGACPGGGLHVFDITGDLERAPVKVGVFFIPDTSIQQGAPQGLAGTVRCTSHVLQIHPEEQIITIAWFAAGVRVLDISGLMDLPVSVGAGIDPAIGGTLGVGITEIGYHRFPDSDVWAAKVPQIRPDGTFEVYAIDTWRGLDVLRVDLGVEDPQVQRGTWQTPQVHAASVSGIRPASALGTYCML